MRARLITAIVFASAGIAFYSARPAAQDPQPRFRTIADLTTFARNGHTETRLLDGRVLLTGGCGYEVESAGCSFLASAEIYDPATETFEPTGSMSVPRIGHTATLLLDGRVLIAGDQGGDFASAEIYDPTAGTFSPTGSMVVERFQPGLGEPGQLVTGRYNHAATRLADGRVLLTGGSSAGRSLRDAEVYDPSTGTFSQVGNNTNCELVYGVAECGMIDQRSAHSTVLLDDGTVLVAGGFGSVNASTSAELFNPATGDFTQVGSLNEPRQGSHTATKLYTGQVLFAGGTLEGGTVQNSAEIYDPATGTFVAVGPMQQARSAFTATLTSSGAVLVVGGYQGGGIATATAELFDPATLTFADAGAAMSAARFSHSATSLADGRVLIFGGGTPGATFLSFYAELFEVVVEINLGDLSHVYDGSVKGATATSNPAGLGVTLTYRQSGTPVASPTDAGIYDVTATLAQFGYVGSATAQLIISKAQADIALSNLTHAYDGSPKSADATTTPADLMTLEFAYDGSTTPPTAAGAYEVVATLDHPNYEGTASAEFVIEKASASIVLSNLTQTYTGGPLTPAAVTTPESLSFEWTNAPQTAAGSYPITATITDPNYTGSASDTFVIAQASANVVLSNLTQTYTGSPLTPTAATTPPGLSIDWTGAPQTNAGSYPVTATVTDPNYIGGANGTFVIEKADASVTLGNMTQTVTGSPLSPTVTVVPNVAYSLIGAPQTSIGSYPVSATVTNPNYQGSANGTFVIAPPLGVTVVTPNGGEKLFVNVPTTLSWTAASATSINVAISRNGGSSYTPIPGCSALPGSATSCVWTPTGSSTTTALLRVTANGAGGSSAVDVSNAVFTITTSSPTVTVTLPNSGVTWAIGTARVLTWTHTLGINTFVKVELTRNDGASWQTLAASVQNSSATAGSLPWIVSAPVTSAARIRVTWLNGPATDISNSKFSIVAPLVTVTAPNTNVSWVIGTTKSITWTHNVGAGSAMRIEKSVDGGSSWTLVTASALNSSDTSGSFSWVVTGPASTTALIRVAWTQDVPVQDMSNVNFKVASRISVTQPNSNVSWAAGSTQKITWSHNYGSVQTFDIDFSPDNGASWIPVAASVPASSSSAGTFLGRLPAVVTNQALVRVSPAGNAGDGDVSNVPFTLVAPIITVTTPNTAVSWSIGSNRTLKWAHNLGVDEFVTIDVSRDGGATWSPVTASVKNSSTTSGSFTWNVTGPSTTQGRIRVTWTQNGSVQDVSNVDFRIP